MEALHDAGQVRATLDAWRAAGADRVNPARFRFIDALERRASSHEGEARRRLDERLSVLIVGYAKAVERAGAEAGGADAHPAPVSDTPAAQRSIPASSARHRGPLADLLDLLLDRTSPAVRQDASAARDAHHPHRHAMPPELAMLDYFRETWSKFSAEKQLRHALEQVPDNAGPLNSNSLVHRSLALMQALSPGYLQQFLSYVEALSWMEQLAGPVAGAAASSIPEPPRAGGAKKNARRKAR